MRIIEIQRTRTADGVTFAVKDAEAKDRRVQLLMKPSTFYKIRAEAIECGVSFNSYVNAVLESHIGG